MSNPIILTAEGKRVHEAEHHQAHWKRWGPYLSERQWGTVREDYSPDGQAWEYFPHDHARSRVYRWGEDGLGGICDRHGLICFALALWNGRDPILKERLFGLTNGEGNHGEDVKELYFYLDSTPTHSYMQYLYKYPHAAFPYQVLIEENARRQKNSPEFELYHTEIFDEDRYFDVFIEYAKSTPEDICIRIRVQNQSACSADLTVLPTIWFRNTWSWGWGVRRPRLWWSGKDLPVETGLTRIIEAEHDHYGHRYLFCDGQPDMLFVENETNGERLWGKSNETPFVKDGLNDYVVQGVKDAVNPKHLGSKGAAQYRLSLGPKESSTLKLRFSNDIAKHPFSPAEFDDVFSQRQGEADEFYALLAPPGASEDHRRVQRQAFAGLLWSKQFYHYDVRRWMRGDPTSGDLPKGRQTGRNTHWPHLFNADVLSVPDKWEYPWYAAWDLAFHCIPFSLIDPAFAKEQLLLLLREWYMHPNGQLPAYEWNFSDVNPPVHAWAAWRVYKIEKKHYGHADRIFLERVFHKLLLNFTWWVNRKDVEGKNIFEGGFLGLDNIAVFDRSAPLPGGGHIEQADGTSWMAMYSLNMLAMALELAKENIAYEDVASKFFEHFVYICESMNNIGGKGFSLWDSQDGFYYDVLRLPDGTHHPLRVRSIVGLIPLFAVETLHSDMIDRLPRFKRRMQWFLENRPELADHVETETREDNVVDRFLTVVNRTRLRKVLRYVLHEAEFLSPYGIRSLSKFHQDSPYRFYMDSREFEVTYEPGESNSDIYGGNSNWRGPIWFPINYLLIEALQKFHYFLGDTYQIEYPAGSGSMTSLNQVTRDLSKRLVQLFLKQKDGRRPIFGENTQFQEDPLWRDYLVFPEFFHGDSGMGLGASHQTGWTALVAKLIHQMHPEDIAR